MTPIICFWLVLISCAGQAQGKDEKPGLLIGVGGGFGTVTKPQYQGGISDSGTNLKFQVGLGLFKIEYEVHHIRDETPELSEIDYDNYPEHFKTYFLLASFQFYLYKGFFMRPSFGFSQENEIFCDWDSTVAPPRCTGTRTTWERKLALGISVGYEYKFTQHIGVALETFIRAGINWPYVLGGEQWRPRSVYGIHVVGTWYF